MGEITPAYVTLWNDIYLTSGIPFWIADMDGFVQYAFPDTMKDMIYRHFFEFCGMEITRHQLKNDVMMTFITDYYYCMLAPLDEHMFLASIPIAIQKPAPLPFNFVQHFLKKDYVSHFVNLISHTYVQSVTQASRCANLIKMAYNAEPVGKIQMSQHKPHRVSNIYEKPDTLHLESIELEDSVQMQNNSLFYEQDIRNAIATGNVDAYLQTVNRRTEPATRQLSTNAVQQQKYRAVIDLYIFSQAAVHGGMDTQFALSLSDTYCLQIDSLNSVSDVQTLVHAAGKDYCERMRDFKNVPPLSPEVSLCCNYISRHLYEPIHLKDLESLTYMNRRSLTIHFKKEIGITIPEYILQRKLKESTYLLKTTNAKIGEISYLLCFSSQSHFTQQFKKQYHMTPYEYRNSTESGI